MSNSSSSSPSSPSASSAAAAEAPQKTAPSVAEVLVKEAQAKESADDNTKRSSVIIRGEGLVDRETFIRSRRERKAQFMAVHLHSTLFKASMSSGHFKALDEKLEQTFYVPATIALGEEFGGPCQQILRECDLPYFLGAEEEHVSVYTRCDHLKINDAKEKDVFPPAAMSLNGGYEQTYDADGVPGLTLYTFDGNSKQTWDSLTGLANPPRYEGKSVRWTFGVLYDCSHSKAYLRYNSRALVHLHASLSMALNLLVAPEALVTTFLLLSRISYKAGRNRLPIRLLRKIFFDYVVSHNIYAVMRILRDMKLSQNPGVLQYMDAACRIAGVSKDEYALAPRDVLQNHTVDYSDYQKETAEWTRVQRVRQKELESRGPPPKANARKLAGEAEEGGKNKRQKT